MCYLELSGDHLFLLAVSRRERFLPCNKQSNHFRYGNAFPANIIVYPSKAVSTGFRSVALILFVSADLIYHDASDTSSISLLTSS